jgi:toxin YoeB
VEVIFTPEAFEDLRFWKQGGNKSVQSKITVLIDSICANPFAGIGKPEPLQYNLSGKWSRRINKEHRLIYSISDKIYIYSLRGHYGK